MRCWRPSAKLTLMLAKRLPALFQMCAGAVMPPCWTLTAKFDRLTANNVADLAVSRDEIEAALDALTPSLRDSLETAAKRIRAFHERQRPEGFDYTDDTGVGLGMRYTPVDAAGLYVPWRQGSLSVFCIDERDAGGGSPGWRGG